MQIYIMITAVMKVRVMECVVGVEVTECALGVRVREYVVGWGDSGSVCGGVAVVVW